MVSAYKEKYPYNSSKNVIVGLSSCSAADDDQQPALLKPVSLIEVKTNFFGLYLGYDNRDAIFNVKKLDGHLTGLLWNTQGDDNQRKYDYTYDNAGRLTKADFREKKTTGDAWNAPPLSGRHMYI